MKIINIICNIVICGLVSTVNVVASEKRMFYAKRGKPSIAVSKNTRRAHGIKKQRSAKSQKAYVQPKKNVEKASRVSATKKTTVSLPIKKNEMQARDRYVQAQALVDTYARKSKGELSDIYLKKFKVLINSFFGPLNSTLHKNGDHHIMRIETELDVLRTLLKRSGVSKSLLNLKSSQHIEDPVKNLRDKLKHYESLFQGITFSEKNSGRK